VAIAVIAVLLAREYFAARKGSGLIYNGKTLEYWLGQTASTSVITNGVYARIGSLTIGGYTYGATVETDADVERALRAIGTNCLPFLVKKLGAHETRISRTVERLKVRLKMKVDLLGRDWERGQAVTAFTYLDPLPDDIYEQIRRLSKCGTPEVATSAKYVLQQCHKMSDVHPTLK